MAGKQERNKKGILSLAGLLVLTVLVVALSNPLYELLSGGGGEKETYTSVQQGYGGEVRVTITVKDGKVALVTAEGSDETPGLGGRAVTDYNETVFPEMKGQAVVGLSTAIDAMSGATMTSSAVQAGFLEAASMAAAAQ